MLLGAIFKSITTPKSKPKTSKEAYAQYYGSKMAASGNYKSPKSGLEQIKSDIQADFFGGKKDADYYARLYERKEKSKKMSDQMMKSMSKNSAPSSKPKDPSAAEIALAKRKAAGQEARKKFEKEKGERRIALRKRYMKLLKLA